MSAFLCSNDTFAALVTAFDTLKNPGESFAYGYELFKDSKEAAMPIICGARNECELMRNILAYENVRSLAARYPADADDDGVTIASICAEPFKPVGEVTQWIMARQYGKVLHLLASYEYQSCESNDWQTTTAFKFCCELKNQILRRLRNSIPDSEQPSWGSYQRPAGNPGPISLSALLR